ncbi:aspartate kinase, partial [Staphylococcus cohnii]
LHMSDTLLSTIDQTLESYIATLKDKPSRLLDALLSCGENFNAQLIAEYNNSQGIPTRYISPGDAGITVTDLPQNAQILDQSYEALYKLREYDEKLIIPGFFGLSRQNYIVTFPRGGSDITGAIVARGVRADIY